MAIFDFKRRLFKKGMSHKKRSPNFSLQEEKLLINCVKKYMDIIEKKQNDSITNKRKNDCWKTLCMEFNSHSTNPPRDYMSLKMKYENLKKKIKRKFAEENVYSSEFITNGSPAKKTYTYAELENQLLSVVGGKDTERSEFEDELLSLVGSKDTGRSEFEEDSSSRVIELDELNQEKSDSYLITPKIELIYDEQDAISESSTTCIDSKEAEMEESSCDSSDDNPTMPKTSAIPASQPKNDDNNCVNINNGTRLRDNVSKWAASKVAVTSIQEKNLKEAHAFKIRCMSEEYKKKIDYMKTEHLMRIELLNLEKRQHHHLQDLEKRFQNESSATNKRIEEETLNTSSSDRNTLTDTTTSSPSCQKEFNKSPKNEGDCKMLKETISNQNDRDESSVFSEHIAKKHRKYSANTKSTVEHLISNILYAADMGKYDDPNFTPSFSS